jgi:predicted transcriptional regulator
MLEPGQIGAARKRQGLTQTELAKRSGVSQSLIAKIEAGLLDPSFTKLKALSQALEAANGHRTLGAQEIMRRDVVLMYATESVEQAIEHMGRHGISQLPVFDEGVLVGTVTEASLLAYVAGHRGDAEALRTHVRHVMTAALPQVAPETPVDGLLSLLEVFPAVLVAANGRIQGIVTKSDLLRATKNGA